MAASARLNALIDEALSYSRVSRLGCLVSNTAAEELGASDDSALPEIENAVRSRVDTTAKNVADHHELLQKYPGLLNLWIAYFRIAGSGNIARVAGFMRSLDGPTLATAILALSAVWHNKGAGITLPPPLLDLLREVAERRTGTSAEVAKHQLQNVWTVAQ